MSILKKLKNVYDSIEPPQELDYVVNKSIHQGKLKKKNRYRTYIKFATSAVVTTFALFVILLNTNESFAKSMENIPVISKLAEVFTINEYEESSEIDLIKAKVPAIRNTGNTDLENRINYEISTKINDIIEEAKNRAEEYKVDYTSVPGGVGPITTYTLAYNLYKAYCLQNKINIESI